MSFGFFIWLIFAVGIAGFAWWSFRMQMLQKKAWEAFANKFDLEFAGKELFQSPRMEGFFEDRYISAYEGEELDQGGRQRRSTLIEMDMQHALPFSAIVVKRNEQALYKTLEKQLEIPSKLKLEDKKWEKKFLVGTNSQELTKIWLAPERLEAIEKAFSIPNTKAVFLANDERAFFIMQMNVPLTDPKMLVKVFRRLGETMEILEVPDFLVSGGADDQAGEDLENLEKTEAEGIESEDIPVQD